jgi:hypothetical protein
MTGNDCVPGDGACDECVKEERSNLFNTKARSRKGTKSNPLPPTLTRFGTLLRLQRHAARLLPVQAPDIMKISDAFPCINDNDYPQYAPIAL